MFYKRKFAKSIIILSVSCLCFFFLNSTLPQAKKYPTSTVIEDVSITKDKALNIVLPDGFLISGKITDAAGIALEGAGVSASEQNSFMTNFANANEKGKYQISLAKGTYVFRIEPPVAVGETAWTLAGNSRATALVKTVEVTKKQTRNFKLENGVFLEGNVLNDLGLPAVGTVLYAESNASVLHAEESSNNLVYASLIDSETGNYRISLPVGMYELNVIRSLQMAEEGFSSFTNKNLGVINLKNDTMLNETVPKGILVQGRLKDKKGKAVGAMIHFLNRKDLVEKNPWTRNNMVLSGDAVQGINYQAGLTKGKYTVHVMPFQIEGTEFEYSKRATFRIINKNLKKNKKLNVTLNEGLILSGTVKDKKGKKVEFAFVVITDMKTPQDVFNKNKFIAVTLVSEGKFYYPLPAGSYDIHVIPPPPDFSLETEGLIPSSSRKGYNKLKYLELINRVTTNFIKSLK